MSDTLSKMKSGAVCQFRQSGVLLLVAVASVFLITARPLEAEETVPDQVLNIFETKCAFSGCHAGTAPSADLDLTADAAFGALVNQQSSDFPQLRLVKPGSPLKSYLMMKLVGTSRIKGTRMPRDQPLEKTELRVIAAWIKALSGDVSRVPQQKQKYANAFSGFSSATLQTPATIGRGTFSYRIAHRWLGQVNSGFDQLFGLDAGAHVLTQFAFPVRDNLMFTVGRSGTNATFVFHGKLRFMREKTNGRVPLSAAFLAGVDWLTAKQIPDPRVPGQLLSRTDGERFQWYGQLILSKRLSNRLSFMLSPGVLLNGNVTQSNEKPIVSLGFVARLALTKGLAVFVEGVPILSGISGALPVGGAASRQSGGPVVYDAFTVGLEHNIGGHVFHMYITNSLGLTPAQVMSGGNLDFSGGDFRLGFNIYRTLRFP